MIQAISSLQATAYSTQKRVENHIAGRTR